MNGMPLCDVAGIAQELTVLNSAWVKDSQLGCAYNGPLAKYQVHGWQPWIQ